MSRGSKQNGSPGDGMRRLLDSQKAGFDKAPALQAIFDRVASASTVLMREFSLATCTFMLDGISPGSTLALLNDFESGFGAIFFSPEWDARIVIGCDRRFAFSILEAMYGADGSEPVFDGDRAFTGLEGRIVKALLIAVAEIFRNELLPICPISFSCERVETALALPTIGLSDAPALMAQLDSQIMDRDGRLFVLLPTSVLFPFRKRLEKDGSPEPAQIDPAWSRQMRLEAGRTEIEITAILEGSNLTLGALSALRPGQIMLLESTPDTLIDIEVEAQALFKAKLGQSKGLFTVSIDRRIDGRDEMLLDILEGQGTR